LKAVIYTGLFKSFVLLRRHCSDDHRSSVGGFVDLRAALPPGCGAARGSDVGHEFRTQLLLDPHHDGYLPQDKSECERESPGVDRANRDRVIVAISMLRVPLIQYLSNETYQYLQSVQAYIAAPISATFLIGVLWKRATGRAAFATLVTGGLRGAVFARRDA
jgi:hypothetical protein